MTNPVQGEQSDTVPSFDILLPYYGDATLMQAAIKSVLAQQDSRWRLKVLDDAYPDEGVATWVRGLADPRTDLQRAALNVGVNRSFQRLLEASSADYVSFFGCDDILLPPYVGSMRRLMRQFPDAAVIQPGVRVVDSRGTAIRSAGDLVKAALRSRFPSGPALVGGERLAASLLTGNWTYFPSLVWKRSWIADRGFREGLEVVLDLELLFEVIARGGRMAITPEVTYEYRRHSSSVSSTWAADGRRFEEEREFFAMARERATELGWRRAELSARLHMTSRLHSLFRRAQRPFRSNP